MIIGSLLVYFLEMTLSLWMGLYLLARGYASVPTRLVVGVLVTLAGAGAISFFNLFQPIAGVGAWWAFLLTIALLLWYETLFGFLPAAVRRRRRWAQAIVWGLGLAKMVLLVVFRDNFPGTAGASAWIVAGQATPLSILDAFFILFTAGSLLQNLRVIVRVGVWPDLRSPQIACALGAAGMAYGALALFSAAPIPRWPMDALLTAGVVALGYSMAYHEALIMRHTPLLEFPVAGLTIAALSGLYLLAGRALGLPGEQLGALGLLAVLTHSAYDLVRELVGHWLYRRESEFRRHLRGLARALDDDEALTARLQAGLDSLCRTLGAGGGFIALVEPAGLVVRATRNSLPFGECLPGDLAAGGEAVQPAGALARAAAWLVPVQAGPAPLAVIGVRARQNGTGYSETDLDWLEEAADWTGRLLAMQQQQEQDRTQVQEIAAGAQARAEQVREHADQLLEAIARGPEPEFVKQVEEALRHLADYAALGESALAATLTADGGSHIERGRQVRATLIAAVDSLRPAPARPAGVLPKEWYAYAILNDAYIEDVPNREIMARLYISEGTFNRQRRKALQAVARALHETQAAPASAA